MRRAAIGVAMIALLAGAGRPVDPPPRTTAIDRQRAVQQQRVVAAQAAVARLLATVQAMTRLPAIAVLAQPGSIDDLVHVHAVLAGVRPELHARLAALRDEVGRSRAIGSPPVRTGAVYRLPVAGRLVTGFGTVSEAGVRSRGLGFAVAPGAPVVAPAAGVVRYAQAFRGYGGTVIVDHGRGWTSVLTGLGTLAVRPGGRVRGGARIGTARRHGTPQVTLELRRRGEPVDAAALIR